MATDPFHVAMCALTKGAIYDYQDYAPGEWVPVHDDPDLAERWHRLGDLPQGTLGRAVWEMYRARGFSFPGEPGSVNPLLAQHDFVHVLADYGTTVPHEIEVFGFIAAADPRCEGLLKMVLGLFVDGTIREGAGLFQADVSHRFEPQRLLDAIERGREARMGDAMRVDWHDLAGEAVGYLRRRFNIGPKGEGAGCGPFDSPGEMSPFQRRQGRNRADEDR